MGTSTSTEKQTTSKPEPKTETKEETKSIDDITCDHDIKKSIPGTIKCNNKNIESLYNYSCKYHINKDGSLTFYPSPHLSKINTKLLKTTNFLKSDRIRDIKEKTKYNELEAISNWDLIICNDNSSNICPFINAAIKSFNEHYPFKISPNNILLLVLQGIAIHVDKNSEKLRDKYVEHDGKMKLTVERDSKTFILRKKCKTNDWNGVIDEFVEQINKNTKKDVVKMMEMDFSDSNIIDKISGKITIMDICQNYFKYEMICVPMCGFPKITLSGNKNDWINLKNKINQLLTDKVLESFGNKWKKSLLPLLDQFINSFNGKIDCLFWNSMIKSGVTETELASSGGPMYKRDYWYSGWFNILFPFCCKNTGEFYENERCFIPYSMSNEYVKGGIKDAGKNGNDIKVFPMGLSSAPVKTLYIDAATFKKYNYNMKFISGIIGYKQCKKTFEISPQTGWIICYDE